MAAAVRRADRRDGCIEGSLQVWSGRCACAPLVRWQAPRVRSLACVSLNVRIRTRRYRADDIVARLRPGRAIPTSRRAHTVLEAVLSLPFNEDLPLVGPDCAAANHNVLQRHIATELRRQGWIMVPTQGGCILRRADPAYPAKRFEISLRRLRGGLVQGQGELRLHGMVCASTGLVRWRPLDAVAAIRRLRVATESLNVFADSGF